MKFNVFTLLLLIGLLSGCASRQMRACKFMCQPGAVKAYKKAPVSCICER